MIRLHTPPTHPTFHTIHTQVDDVLAELVDRARDRRKDVTMLVSVFVVITVMIGKYALAIATHAQHHTTYLCGACMAMRPTATWLR